MSNPLDDFKARIADALAMAGHLTMEALDQIEADIRQDWGGDRFYLPRRGEPDRDCGQRNRAIIRDWRNGERVELIARRYGITKRRVWQIVKG